MRRRGKKAATAVVDLFKAIVWNFFDYGPVICDREIFIVLASNFLDAFEGLLFGIFLIMVL